LAFGILLAPARTLAIGETGAGGDPVPIHILTWTTGSTCDTWWASYSIDGHGSHIYAQGVWTGPIGVVDIPRYDVPNDQGWIIYPQPYVPAMRLWEPENCLADRYPACVVELLYPMATYIDADAPAGYWRGGLCEVIHPQGQIPSAARVTQICSLSTYQYHPTSMQYDGYVMRVTCPNHDPVTYYNGEQLPETQISQAYDVHGNRK
jgi:hypothetical protein